MLAQALELLETATAPTLAESPEPIHDDELSTLACALPPRFDPDEHPAVYEARALRPAYGRAIARYGNRAATGRVVAADDIPAAIEAFTRVAAGPVEAAEVAGQAAVHRVGGAGDVVGVARREEQRQPADLLRLGDPLPGDGQHLFLEHVGVVDGRLVEGREHHPRRQLLTLIFDGASSRASVRVRFRTAPLEQS